MYLRNRPPGRNKIQDAWAATVYKVVDIQGTTYAVVPLEGGPERRVHRSNLRPCAGPAPVLGPVQHDQEVSCADDHHESETEIEDPEFLLMEEIRYPVEQPASEEPKNLDLMNDVSGNDSENRPGLMESEDPLSLERSEGSSEDLEGDPITYLSPVTQNISIPREEAQATPVPAPRRIRKGRTEASPPTPATRKSRRETAGVHSNPFNLPRSACNAVSFSPDILSQVLAGMVLYTTKLKGLMDEQGVTEDVDY